MESVKLRISMLGLSVSGLLLLGAAFWPVAKADDVVIPPDIEYLARPVIRFDSEKLAKRGIHLNDAFKKVSNFLKEHSTEFKESELCSLNFANAEGQVYSLKEVASVDVIFRSKVVK
jgi:hypothetical protein